MGYTKSAIAGFSWQSALKASTIGLGVIKMMIVARILSPADFGLFSLVTIALGVAEATTETGVNFTIINSEHSVKYFLNTAWVIAIVRGFIIGLLMLVSALFLSDFFDQPSLLLLISMASLVPVIKGFINPGIVSLRKELRFFSESGYHFARLVAETLFAIVLTVVTQNVSALILAMVGAALFEVVISFAFFEMRPHFQYLHSRGKIILGHAKGLSLNALLSYLNENLDNLLIGKITSPYALGLYHNSYSLTHKVTHEFGKSAAHGTFPIFSKLVNQPLRLQRAVWRSTAGTMAVTVLAAVPFLIWPQLIVWVLGAQWTEAVPLIRILVLAGLLQTFSSLMYSYFVSIQAFALVNWHLASTVIVMAISILVLGSQYGLIGSVSAILISRLITLPIILWGVHRIWQR